MNNDILTRFINHQCTLEEINAIDEWLASDPENARYLFEMEHIWSLKNLAHYADEQRVKMAYQQLEPALKPQRRARKLRAFVRYAAVFVLFITVSLYLYRTVWSQDEPGFNMIEVPRGELACVTLSDGTRVWLNADTRFTYPERFGRRSREVTLEGEGFFEVASDAGRPFMVHGGRFSVRVLGTTFNVRAHPEEDAEISLKTGKLQVTDADDSKRWVVMSPNQQVRYGQDGKMVLSRVDLSSVDSWRNGGVSFLSQPLSAIIKTLERKYEVNITLKDEELAGEVFNCRAREGSTLPQVLDLLRDTRRLQYTFESDKHVIITKNN